MSGEVLPRVTEELADSILTVGFFSAEASESEELSEEEFGADEGSLVLAALLRFSASESESESESESLELELELLAELELSESERD